MHSRRVGLKVHDDIVYAAALATRRAVEIAADIVSVVVELDDREVADVGGASA